MAPSIRETIPTSEEFSSSFYKTSTGKFEDILTNDGEAYHFYPIAFNSISFKIKAPNDAHIALTTTRYESEPMYEIFFGEWKNTKSGIGKNRVKPNLVEVVTPNILDENSYIGFWIRWENRILSVGIQGDMHPFMVHNDSKLINIRYFGVSTRWGASGHWIIENDAPKIVDIPAILKFRFELSDDKEFNSSIDSFDSGVTGKSEASIKGIVGKEKSWVSSSNGKVPPGAVVTENNISGEISYLVRAYHEGVHLQGVLIPSHGVAYVTWKGHKYPKINYDVLCYHPEVSTDSVILNEMRKMTLTGLGIFMLIFNVLIFVTLFGKLIYQNIDD